MVTNLNQTISIAKHIVDGSITIDSISEFRSILRIFPYDAEKISQVFVETITVAELVKISKVKLKRELHRVSMIERCGRVGFATFYCEFTRRS